MIWFLPVNTHRGLDTSKNDYRTQRQASRMCPSGEIEKYTIQAVVKPAHGKQSWSPKEKQKEWVEGIVGKMMSGHFLKLITEELVTTHWFSMLGELKPTKTKHDSTRQTHIETHYSQFSKNKR